MIDICCQSGATPEMRLLLFKSKSSEFFLSLETPTSRELQKLDDSYPAAASLFHGELDIMRKASVPDLLKESRAFLSANSKSSRLRSAKSIEVRYTNREFINGPAEGITGFKINGIPCSACVENNGVKISLFEDEKRKHIFVTSERYRVDDGELIVHFRSGTSLCDFFSRLEQSLATTKKKFVWCFVES